MRKKLSRQQSRIVRYCKDFGCITAWEAAKDLGIMRLGARIFELKEMGFEVVDRWITDVNRYGEEVRYKSYMIVSGNDD